MLAYEASVSYFFFWGKGGGGVTLWGGKGGALMLAYEARVVPYYPPGNKSCKGNSIEVNRALIAP
jgi:hypothetical protein